MIHRALKVYTGIDIEETSIRVAQITRQGATWKLMQYESEPLPAEALQLSYREENILSEALFKAALQNVLKRLAVKPAKIGLSLPGKIIKISLHTYEELPKKNEDILKLLSWEAEKAHQLKENTLRISYAYIGRFEDGERLLLSMGIKKVIDEYARQIEDLSISARVILPSGISQLNFYSSALPDKGTFAYVGLFDKYCNIFIFEDARIKLFHGAKKGFSDLLFYQAVETTLKHYRNMNPEVNLEKILIGSHVGFHTDLEALFSNLSHIDIEILNDDAFIQNELDLSKVNARDKLSNYIAAIGAAQSLAIPREAI